MSKFEEEYKRVRDTNIRLVCEYLMSRNDMRAKLDNPKKSIYKMWDYVISQAKKQANDSENKHVASCNSDEVYGWAIHYYDEEDVGGDEEQPSRLNLESAKAIVKTSVEKKKKPKKEESEWKQESLF